MRFRILLLAAAAVVLAACDQLSTRIFASAAPSGASATALAIVPAQAQIVLGATLQLTTNAPAALQPQVQWQSLQPAIAGVTPTGVVTALAIGTAVVQARVATDTTRTALATITVVGPPTPTTGGAGGTGG